MRAKTALLTMVVIYVGQWMLADVFDIYAVFPWFDNVMHLAGGFATGMLGVAIHHNITNEEHRIDTPYWYHILFVVGFVALVAVAWEFHEYLIDNTIGLWYDWPQYQLSLRDTMSDLSLGGLGGLLAAHIFKKEW